MLLDEHTASLDPKMERLILDEKKRKSLGEKAGLIAKERFCPELTLERMPLIIEAAQASFQSKKSKSLNDKITNLYKSDLKIYGLSHLF